jgi:hypothetical protein
VLQWPAFQRSIDLGHPCVVHQYIDSTKPLDHRVHQALRRRFVRKVFFECQYSLIAGIEFSRTFVDAPRRRCDRKDRTRGVQAACDRESYPLGASGARDQRNLLVECSIRIMLYAHGAM